MHFKLDDADWGKSRSPVLASLERAESYGEEKAREGLEKAVITAWFIALRDGKSMKLSTYVNTDVEM